MYNIHGSHHVFECVRINSTFHGHDSLYSSSWSSATLYILTLFIHYVLLNTFVFTYQQQSRSLKINQLHKKCNKDLPAMDLYTVSYRQLICIENSGMVHERLTNTYYCVCEKVWGRDITWQIPKNKYKTIQSTNHHSSSPIHCLYHPLWGFLDQKHFNYSIQLICITHTKLFPKAF